MTAGSARVDTCRGLEFEHEHSSMGIGDGELEASCIRCRPKLAKKLESGDSPAMAKKTLPWYQPARA